MFYFFLFCFEVRILCPLAATRGHFPSLYLIIKQKRFLSSVLIFDDFALPPYTKLPTNTIAKCNNGWRKKKQAAVSPIFSPSRRRPKEAPRRYRRAGNLHRVSLRDSLDCLLHRTAPRLTALLHRGQLRPRAASWGCDPDPHRDSPWDP
jgi:hypothetical protein